MRACFSYPRVFTGRLQGFIRSLDPEIIVQPQRTKIQEAADTPHKPRRSLHPLQCHFYEPEISKQANGIIAFNTGRMRECAEPPSGSAWPLPQIRIPSLILNSVITGSSKNVRTTTARLDVERPYKPSFKINCLQEFLVRGQ